MFSTGLQSGWLAGDLNTAASDWLTESPKLFAESPMNPDQHPPLAVVQTKNLSETDITGADSFMAQYNLGDGFKRVKWCFDRDWRKSLGLIAMFG